MSKFKVGDTVRFKESDFNDVEIHVDEGDYGIVTKVSKYFVSVKPKLQLDPCILVVAPDEIELAEPTDRKTAFLEELRALLIKYKYNACIQEHGMYEVEGIDFIVGEDEIYNKNVRITANNIMGYDKEGV